MRAVMGFIMPAPDDEHNTMIHCHIALLLHRIGVERVLAWHGLAWRGIVATLRDDANIKPMITIISCELPGLAFFWEEGEDIVFRHG